ncbi:unnamed protein product, partial [Gulo gulo]
GGPTRLPRTASSPPAGGGVSGAGPERLSPGPRPGRAQLPAAPTMAAAALGQIWARKLLPVSWLLCGSRRYASSNFKAADLQLEMTQEPHQKPDPSKPLVFGKIFTDHMLVVEWKEEKGWGRPRIQPFQNLTLHPACSGLHYSMQARHPTSLPVSLHLFPLPCVSLGPFFPGHAHTLCVSSCSRCVP